MEQLTYCCHFTGDLSSISGSESDSEDEDSDSDAGVKSRTVSDKDMESSGETPLTAGRLSSKLVFQNSVGDYLLVYRCILKGKVRISPMKSIICLKKTKQNTLDLYNLIFCHFSWKVSVGWRTRCRILSESYNKEDYVGHSHDWWRSFCWCCIWRVTFYFPALYAFILHIMAEI